MAIDPKYLPEVFPKKARKITPRIPRHYGMSQEVYDLMPEGLIQNLTPIQVFVFLNPVELGSISIRFQSEAYKFKEPPLRTYHHQLLL
jgi:hypothetical protein